MGLTAAYEFSDGAGALNQTWVDSTSSTTMTNLNSQFAGLCGLVYACKVRSNARPTGTPYNWIRSEKERHAAHRNIGFFARYCFGPEPLVTINAFSMGAWATGINMSLALNRTGIVKSTGPDIAKILSTLRFLGPEHRYLICGYPPFLKHLID